MTLKEMRTQPLVNILDKMDMVDLKVHTDDRGNICAIEIKYEPTAENAGSEKKGNQSPRWL